MTQPRRKPGQGLRTKDQGQILSGDGPRATDHGHLLDRHFVWELFSAGTPVARAGKDLNQIPVAVAGKWVKDGRRSAITAADLRDMAANFGKRKNEMLVIDYEHASELPEVARGGPVPAAGWIHELHLDPSGSAPDPGVAAQDGDSRSERLAALVEWTPEARKLISSGQYRFFSPSIDWGACDKQTGDFQGATLTSGALTNHPFLEELPPLMLTGRSTMVAAGAGLRTAQTGTRLASGQGDDPMENKRLNLRKITDGPAAGHHGVYLDDDPLGYLTDEDFAGYGTTNPGVQPDGDEVASGIATFSTVFAERVGAAGEGLDDIRRLVEEGRRARASERETIARALILSEVVKDGQLRMERALELARSERISLADYVAVQSAERALERAVVDGKILPRDRQFFFRDALERPREFGEFVGRAAAVVRFGSEGLGSGEAVPVDQEVDLSVRRLMSEHKTSYSKALKNLFRENPALETRYRQAHSQPLPEDLAAE